MVDCSAGLRCKGVVGRDCNTGVTGRVDACREGVRGGVDALEDTMNAFIIEV